MSARPGGHNKSASIAYTNESSSDRGINFTMFLTMMSERLFEFDPEAELVEAFESFDEHDAGVVKVEEMRKWLGEFGERMDDREVNALQSNPCASYSSNEQIDRFLRGPFTDRQDNFNYREWVKVLRINDDNDQPDPQT